MVWGKPQFPLPHVDGNLLPSGPTAQGSLVLFPWKENILGCFFGGFFVFFFFTAGIQAGGGAQGLAYGNIYICFWEFWWVFSCADRILVAAGECGHTACTLRDGLYSVKAAFPQEMRALLGEGSNFQRSLGSLCAHALNVRSNCPSMCKKHIQGRDECAELCVLVLTYEDLSLPQKKTSTECVYRTLSSFLLLRWYSEVKWKSLSCVRLFVTPWAIQSMKFSRPEYWSG